MISNQELNHSSLGGPMYHRSRIIRLREVSFKAIIGRAEMNQPCSSSHPMNKTNKHGY